MSNIKAIVRYDGTDFAGWQIQPNAPTVQETIETALATIAGCPIKIAGAGRTDSGVHALGQVFSCDWPEKAPLENLHRSLNKMLAPSIRIESIESAANDFHASFSASGKRYTYCIALSPHPDPFLSRYAWTIGWNVSPDKIHELAQVFVGHHDFAGYCCSGSEAKTTDRTLHGIIVNAGSVVGPVDAANTFNIEFHGEGFLYKMVRNLVGTLVDVARGHLSEPTIYERLNAPGPYRGFTAPACGLFMKEVVY
jgi:tRNA pseudouridine38-40 synthase